MVRKVDRFVRAFHEPAVRPCQRGFDRIEFYSPADISLGEFLSEACLLSLFACGECKRGPMQHRVIFQHGEARLIAELSAREKYGVARRIGAVT